MIIIRSRLFVTIKNNQIKYVPKVHALCAYYFSLIQYLNFIALGLVYFYTLMSLNI